MIRRFAVLVGVSLVVVACGSGDDAMTDDARTLLAKQVAVARGAVAEGDFAGASVTLDEVESFVASLRATEDISDDHADEIDAALDDVRSALASYMAGTTTTTLPPPPTVAEDDSGPNEDQDRGDDKGPDDGRDKGKQRDRGRGDKD